MRVRPSLGTSFALAFVGHILKGRVADYTRADGTVVHGYDHQAGQLSLFGGAPKAPKASGRPAVVKPTQLGLFGAPDAKPTEPSARPAARPKEAKAEREARHGLAMRHLFTARHHEGQADEARSKAIVARGTGDHHRASQHQAEADHHQALAQDHRAKASGAIKAGAESSENKIHRAALEAHDHILRAATVNRITWKDRVMVNFDRKGNFSGAHAGVHARVKSAAAQAIADHHDGKGDLATRLKAVAHEAAHAD